jgi:hypothetical protein
MQWREVGRAGGTGSIGQDGGGGGGRRGVERVGGRAMGGQVGRRDTQCRTSSVGSIEREGDVGVGACRGAPSSVGRLDRWVQEMGLRFITLVGEYRYHIYIY